MMCSVCNSNQATVYFTDIVNGATHTRKLCANCAQKTGLFNFLPMDDVFKSFDNVLKSFDSAFKSMEIPKTEEITCDNCGMTLSKFKQLGRFGCAKDYELFNVAPVLEKIHGTSVHMGKVPAMSQEEKVKRLKKDMEAAIKSESYEKAANIRDEIRKLENPK